MNLIIMSKDRACQLELLLRSMNKFFKNLNNYKINILYTYSNEEFKKGYTILSENYKNVNFVLEKDFKKDMISLVNPMNEYTMFLMDDIVFKEDFSMDDYEVKLFKANKNIMSLSLRLHSNLTYCYPARLKMNKPKLLFEKNIINWKQENGDFGYPMSLDGNLWRTTQILNYINNFNYNNPNSLESAMAIRPLDIPFLLFYEKSKIINLPINKVQTFNNNFHGNISAEYLNKEFLNNKRIVMENIEHIENTAFHQELKIILE